MHNPAGVSGLVTVGRREEEFCMNWDAIGALSELAGAAAVVGSIGYLAVQVRQNSRFSKAASQQAFISQTAAGLRALVEKPDGLRIAQLAILNFHGLAPDDKAVAYALFNEWITRMEQALYLHDAGLLPGPVFDASRAITLSILGSPGGSQYWEMAKGAFVGADVRRYLDAQLEAGSNLPPPLSEVLPWFRQA
jgi:hypothetical protein